MPFPCRQDLQPVRRGVRTTRAIRAACQADYRSSRKHDAQNHFREGTYPGQREAEAQKLRTQLRRLEEKAKTLIRLHTKGDISYEEFRGERSLNERLSVRSASD